MVGVLSNFLTSGHAFTEDENLQRFRFSLLNSILIISLIFSLINYFASLARFVEFSSIYEKALLAFAFVCLVLIYFLRRSENNYSLTATVILLNGLALFYFALITAVQDEFRLIWFFLTLFVGFLLVGKTYGLLLTLVILLGVFIVERTYGLGLSKLALFTFFNSFIIFAVISYLFWMKIERDSLEFNILNAKLRENVKQEVLQREEQEQMLLRQCRMANMGEMLDSIAHQWRQPLMHINSVLMNMDSALEANKKDGKYLEKKIDEVASLTSHMSQTIEDFRGLFKQEKGQKKFFLESAINDVLALMKNSLKDIEVNFISEDNAPVVGYKSELIQVIIILLSNAVDVLNKRKIEYKKITIHTQASKNNDVVIIVKDNAGGILVENIDSVFDPYFTSKKQSGGTGLGLYIARIIVEHKLSGEITAINTANGAKFTILIDKSFARERYD